MQPRFRQSKRIPTVLVTGASGFLGWNACRLLRGHFRLVGTALSRFHEMEDVALYKVDITNFSQLQTLLMTTRPDLVMHTAALSSPDRCQEEPQLSERVNVDASINLAGLCAELGIALLFTSSDMVFGGDKAPYREEDPPAPVNLYGEQKVRAEEGIKLRHPKAAICRLPLLYGFSREGDRNFLEQWKHALQQGKGLSLFTDEVRTPVSAESAVAGLLLAWQQGVRGTLHLGGNRSLSRYDMGIMIARALGLGSSGLRAVSRNDVLRPAPRPGDLSLVSERACALGYDPPSPDLELARLLQAG